LDRFLRRRPECHSPDRFPCDGTMRKIGLEVHPLLVIRRGWVFVEKTKTD